MTSDVLRSEFADHDRAVASQGLDVWVGSEPTFTDRFSYAPEWTSEALGDAKLVLARRFAGELGRQLPGCVVLRTVGRQYPGEPAPRWSFGVYRRRNGAAVWRGPSDPLSMPESPDGAPPADLPARLRDAFARALRAEGAEVEVFEQRGALPHRLLVGASTKENAATPEDRGRAPLGADPLPPGGLDDALAGRGLRLFAFGLGAAEELTVELPGFDGTEPLLHALGLLGHASRELGVAALVLTGYPPPVDATVALTTVTPDPAVVEVNMAPCATLAEYHAEVARLYDVAARVGLSPDRLHYNGDVADSGGGGHVSLGGPSFEQSPFLCRPRTLPKLIAYFALHPALSYFFAIDAVGGSSQSPRADEGPPESYAELEVALDTLLRTPEPQPEALWGSLAPFLVDRFGNAHRSEINVEKLANPHLPGRGRLGVVEFRAFRMPGSADRSAAIACLLRAIVAMLARDRVDRMTGALRVEPRLARHGDALHDRFSLPYYLAQDLGVVLSDLSAAGLGLGPAVSAELEGAGFREVCAHALEGGATLTVRRAVEFWPLVGDLAEQQGTSRTVDSSTTRLEIALRLPDADPDAWRLSIGGFAVPFVVEHDATGVLLLRGVRCRTFRPSPGLHPLLPPHGPLQIDLVGPPGAYRLTLSWWKADGGPYAALPSDASEARDRRRERACLERIAESDTNTRREPSAGALSKVCFDLRRA